MLYVRFYEFKWGVMRTLQKIRNIKIIKTIWRGKYIWNQERVLIIFHLKINYKLEI